MSGEWEPTTRQALLAEYLGTGNSLMNASRLAGVNYRTAMRWYSNPGRPEFIELVRRRRNAVVGSYQAKFEVLVELALDLEAAALRGEIDASDPRIALAHDVLGRTAYRLAGARVP